MRKSKLLIILLFLLLTSCSGKPSAADIREEFEKTTLWGKALSEGLVKITQFDKGDGQLSEVNGVKTYTVSYSTWVIYLKPVAVVKPKSYSSTINISPLIRIDLPENIPLGDTKFVKVEERRANDTELILGQAIFTLYDSGWKPASIKTTSCVSPQHNVNTE